MGADGDRPGTDGLEAGRWPDGADVIALLVPTDAGPEACELAAGAAERSGRERRTLLANLAGPSPDLDGHLGTEAEEGLFDAGRSGLSLREIAVRPPGRRFLYLPAGRPGGADDDARAVRARVVGLMARVAERVRDRRGRLLLFLSEEGEWPEALPGLLDGLVLVEGATVPAAWGDRAPEVFGRRPPDARPADDLRDAGRPEPERDEPPTAPVGGPDGGDGEDADDGGPGAGGDEAPDVDAGDAPAGLEAPSDAGPGTASGWRRHRRSSGLPWARIALGTAAVVALAAGWWWLVRESGPAPGGGGDAAAVEVTVDSAAGAADGDGAEGTGRDGEPPAADGEADGPGAGALEASPELPYSVLIASYAEWDQARRRLEAWRDPSGPVYFVAPTRIRGGLYWRLFAGAVPDRGSGEALMEELVEQGRKDRVRTWDVRPVEFAFLAGTTGSRAEASSRVGTMEERGLPAYTLPAASGRDTTWAVWAGGFESREEASELGALLRDAEIEAELVTRRGEGDTR